MFFVGQSFSSSLIPVVFDFFVAKRLTHMERGLSRAKHILQAGQLDLNPGWLSKTPTHNGLKVKFKFCCATAPAGHLRLNNNNTFK